MFKILVNITLTIILSCILIVISFNIEYIIAKNQMEVNEMESQPKLNFNKKYLICDVCGNPKEKLRPIQLSDFNSKIMICEECYNQLYGKIVIKENKNE